MLGQLIPCGGGAPIPLRNARVIVGRMPICDISLPHSTISSHHCRLEFRDDVWHVTDLGSRNGVKIDGARCDSGRLCPGSILSVAQLRFQVDYGPSDARVADTAGLRSTASPSNDASGHRAKLRADATQAVVAARPALGELIPCSGGDPIPLLKPSLVVGRSTECDITLGFPVVSSRHCQLEFKEGYWHVRDLKSRNGIKVDGVPYHAKYLRPGAVLSIARMRYEIDYKPQADEAPLDENPFAMSLMEKAGLTSPAKVTVALGRTPPEREDPLRKRWTIDESDLM